MIWQSARKAWRCCAHQVSALWCVFSSVKYLPTLPSVRCTPASSREPARYTTVPRFVGVLSHPKKKRKKKKKAGCRGRQQDAPGRLVWAMAECVLLQVHNHTRHEVRPGRGEIGVVKGGLEIEIEITGGSLQYLAAGLLESEVAGYKCHRLWGVGGGIDTGGTIYVMARQDPGQPGSRRHCIHPPPPKKTAPPSCGAAR